MNTDAALFTLADYAALDESDAEDEYISELVRGVVVREPRPGTAHGLVQVAVASALHGWGKEVGADVTTESGYILSEEPPTLRGPDVAVVVKPRAGGPGSSTWTRGAPDVAVEVLSPSDTSTAIHQKTLEYLEAGSHLVWIVDPCARTVTVYRPDGSARMLREHETLNGEDVLPGFAVPLSELFG